MLQDNRENKINGDLRDPNDYDTIFRRIVSEHKIPIGEARAKTKSQKTINLYSIVRLCEHLKLRMDIDSFRGTFSVWFHNEGQEPCEVPVVDMIADKVTEQTEVTESYDDDQVITEKTDRFVDVGPDDSYHGDPEDDIEDLF